MQRHLVVTGAKTGGLFGGGDRVFVVKTPCAVGEIVDQQLLQRIAGILQPVFAIRTGDDIGIGDTDGAAQLIAWCQRHGVRVWQMLPMTKPAATTALTMPFAPSPSTRPPSPFRPATFPI